MKEHNPAITSLDNALRHWGRDDFKQILKQELENLSSGTLPLYEATQRGGKPDDSNISALINSISEEQDCLKINVGVFFHEIMGGCSCGDEPPSENTYCDMLVTIDKNTAEAIFKIV